MSTAATTTTSKPVLWSPGDWNAFFGFGTNILVNLLVLTGLLRFVLKMPDSIVFGRILPAKGLKMCLSTMYYAWLAYRLAEKTGRTKSFHAREAILRHIEDLEDHHLASPRLERGGHTVSLEDLEAELDPDG